MKTMKSHSIYGLYDNSGLQYIGVTSTSLEKRLKEHLREKTSRNTHKHNWIMKHKDEIKIKLLYENLTEQDAYQKEIELIAEYRSKGIMLVNKSSGGEHGALGAKRSDETKQILSIQKLGKRLSDEHKAKIRASCAGINQGNKGRTGQPHKEHTIMKMKTSASKRAKEVDQLTVDGVIVKRHPSITDAAKNTGAPKSNIIACIKGRYQTSGGYRWRLTCNSVVLNEQPGESSDE